MSRVSAGRYIDAKNYAKDYSGVKQAIKPICMKFGVHEFSVHQFKKKKYLDLCFFEYFLHPSRSSLCMLRLCTGDRAHPPSTTFTFWLFSFPPTVGHPPTRCKDFQPLAKELVEQTIKPSTISRLRGLQYKVLTIFIDFFNSPL